MQRWCGVIKSDGPLPETGPIPKLRAKLAYPSGWLLDVTNESIAATLRNHLELASLPLPLTEHSKNLVRVNPERRGTVARGVSVNNIIQPADFSGEKTADMLSGFWPVASSCQSTLKGPHHPVSWFEATGQWPW